jgi:hypothetical protein
MLSDIGSEGGIGKLNGFKFGTAHYITVEPWRAPLEEHPRAERPQ